MAAKRIPIVIPLGGVSEDRAFADQPGGTSQSAANMRATDCATGRQRLSVRAGTKRLNDSQVNGSHKIDHLAGITYGKSNQTLADAGNSLGLELSKGNTVTGDTIGIKCGVQGDVYVIDGNCGITKRNRDGALMWKITLAAKDKNHAVRALLVDATTPDGLVSDFVIAGVSTGGDSTTAKAWAYRQLNDNKLEKVWELEPKGYVEAFAISKDKLLLLCNYPEKNRAQIIVYDDYLTNSPTEVNRWDAPYPGTSMDASPSDGFIFTTHAANSDRDKLGGHAGATFASSDYLIKDLPNYKDRVWADFYAWDLTTVSIEPRNLSYPGTDGSDVAPPGDLLDGGNVRAWIDASGNGRNWYQTAEKIPGLNAAGTAYAKNATPASRGAIYKATGGPNGKGVLHFDGLTCGMISELPFSKDKANRGENLCAIPSYKGAQFVVVIVARASCDNVRRALISQGADPGTNTAAVRWIGVNSNAATNLSSTVGGPADVDGSVSLWEPNGVAGDAGKSSDEPPAIFTPNGNPLGNGLPGSGWAVYTWVCDGGIHDHATKATRSQFRVNGMPCDRWQSGPFSTLGATRLGYYTRSTEATAGFVGDVARILVISDWTDKDGVQQPLLGSGDDLDMRYPDTAWSNNQDSDLARIEGMVAHECGIAHELPGGLQGVLRIGDLPAIGNTVIIGAKTYTWRDTLAAANDVARGATVDRSLVNLWRAINGVGEPDVDYHRDTTPNADWRALAPTQQPPIPFTLGTWTDGTSTFVFPVGFFHDFWPGGGAIGPAGSSQAVIDGEITITSVLSGLVNLGTFPITTHVDDRTVTASGSLGSGDGTGAGFVTLTYYGMIVRSRNPNAVPGVAFGGTMTNGSWASTSSRAVVDGIGGNMGWYPHPFYLDRTDKTHGGPPRTSGVTTISPYWQLRSPFPILAAWDPASGKAKSVLTTGYDDDSPNTTNAGTSVGGIGACVRCASSGFVYTVGPRAAIVAAGAAWGGNGTAAADNVDVRKIAWTNQAFVLQGTGWWLWDGTHGSFLIGGGAAFSPGELTYSYPRMAVDKYDNLFLPYAGPGSTGLWIFRAAGSGGNAVVISSYTLADSNDGYCVDVDPTYPDFTDFASLQRAEFCVLGAQQAGANRNSIFRLHTLTVTQAAGTPRATKLVAVSFGNIATVTPSTITTKGTGATGFDSSTSLVMSTPFLGKLYLTDGRKLKVYDPRADTLADHVATSSGGAPTGYALIATWNDSLVCARHRDNPSQYIIGKQGDPGSFDTDPYTISQSQAVLGVDSSAGLPTDIINAFIPWFDDVAIIGGDRSIRRITGRPSPGSDGSIHLVTPAIGIAFGKAWCISPTNTLFFFGSRGGVFFMYPGGGVLPLSSTQDKTGTRAKIERRLQNIDLSVYRIEMEWNDRDKGVHVVVVPIGAGGTNVEHYFWEQATNAWQPDTYAISTIQPTCIGVNDSDVAAERKVLFGCEDGRLRFSDGTVEADDVILATGVPTYPINARVLIGPLVAKEFDSEVLFSALEAVLANDQDGRPWCYVYVTDRADYLGPPVWTGQLERGRNPLINFRRRGAFVFLEFRSSDKFGRWAIEQLSIAAEAMGMKRVVPT